MQILKGGGRVCQTRNYTHRQWASNPKPRQRCRQGLHTLSYTLRLPDKNEESPTGSPFTGWGPRPSFLYLAPSLQKIHFGTFADSKSNHKLWPKINCLTETPVKLIQIEKLLIKFKPNSEQGIHLVTIPLRFRISPPSVFMMIDQHRCPSKPLQTSPSILVSKRHSDSNSLPLPYCRNSFVLYFPLW